VKAGSASRPARRFAAVVAATGAAMLSFGASSAAAQEFVGTSCSGPTAASQEVGGGGGAYQLAQTFVSLGTGNVTSVDLVLFRTEAGDGDFVVDIVTVVDGEPTDIVLGGGSIPFNSVPSNGEASNVAFNVPAPVFTGQEYAIRVYRTGTGQGAVGTRGEGVSCAPGALFKRPNPGGPWAQQNDDMVFTVWVAPSGAGGGKADGTLTIDSNKGKVEKGRKVTLSGQYDVPTNEACERDRTVELQRKRKNAPNSAFKTFKTVKTDDTGNYDTRQRVRKTRVFRAVVGETEACDHEESNTQKVRVQKRRPAQEA
jgi:hypothetical protein